MAMNGGGVIAQRVESRNKQEAILRFFSSHSNNDHVWIEENTSMVDGIGGTTWEGSLILGRLLEQLIEESGDVALESFSVLELGAGAGLVSLQLAKFGLNVIVTDRESDLARQNFSNFHRDNPETNVNADIRDLDWAEDSLATLSSIINTNDPIGLVIGAEIICLRKQHRFLIRNLLEISHHAPNAVMLFTIDGIAHNREFESVYEKEFLAMMKDNGFNFSIIHNAKVCWERDPSQDVDGKLGRIAYYQDLRHSAFQDFDLESRCLISKQPVREEPLSSSEDHFHHHIVAVYRPALANTCCRCTRQFINHPIFNSTSCCRYHPGLYVCRWHPAELRCSINGKGDNLGYYGNGEEGWPAMFWDCCGSEMRDQIGCKAGKHIPY